MRTKFFPWPENLLRRLRLNGDCVETTLAPGNKGYARVYVDGVYKPAHRAMYELMVGPIPDDLVVDHLCRNRICVNPAHLEVVTSGENVLRGIGPTAENARKTSCKHGHPFDEENTYVDPRGWRQCRTCLADAQARYLARKAAA